MAFADIKLGSSFDAKGFKQAQTASQKLEKNVKSLAKSFGLAFGTAAVVRFGKASVKAFAEDQKSAVALTQTLKNLSLGFANTGIEDFITKMSLSTGVADDQLRPAMQKLLQTNLDVAASQKLMGLALDISAAGFGDVASVAGDLSQAMVGNVKGIKKYNLGITQAELSSMSFAEIVERLTKTFKGQAAAAADTYAGKLNIIKNAAGEAQETIGKSLIDALMKVGNNQNMQGLVDDILAAGEGIGYLISGIGDLVKTIGSIPGFGFEGVGKNAPMPFTLNPLAILAQKAYKDQLSAQYKLEEKRLKNAMKMKWLIGAAVNPTKDTILTREEVMAGMTPSQKRKEIADKKAAAAAAKARAAELARIKALAAAKIKTDKMAAANKAKLDKAAAVLDLQKIQIAAALKGKISEEEKTRLLLMQAIEEGNADKAETLQKKLEDIQKKNAEIAAELLALGKIDDPFSTWAGSLALALEALRKLGVGITNIPGAIPGVNYNPNQNADRNYDTKAAAAAAAAKAAADKAAADKAAADKAAAEAAAILGGAAEKAAAEKAAADAAAAKLAKDAADKAAAAALGGAGITFNEEQNPDRNYDTKAEAEQAAAAAAAALAVAPTNGSPVAGVNFNPGQSRDRNFDAGYSNAPTIIVNNNGSVIMQDEFVDAVNNALLAAERTGYSRTPAGTLVDSG